MIGSAMAREIAIRRTPFKPIHKGGRVNYSGSYIVGERGPEAFIPGGGEFIIPAKDHHKFEVRPVQSGKTINITIGGRNG